MSELVVIAAIVVVAFVMVMAVAWLAYRAGYVAGYEDAIDTHNLAVFAPWQMAHPATRHDRESVTQRTYPYRGEVE